MNEWQPIETLQANECVEVWAKKWNSRTDDFEYAVFLESRSIAKNGGLRLMDIPEGWRVTHWRKALTQIVGPNGERGAMIQSFHHSLLSDNEYYVR